MSFARRMQRQTAKETSVGKGGMKVQIPKEVTDKIIEGAIEGAMAKFRTEMVHYEREISELRKLMDTMKANIMATNHILMNMNVYTPEQYDAAYQNIYRNIIGMVSSEGKMEGATSISLFNF